jgi:ribosomal protein S18 acetylase RimI-like enzyme
MRDEHISQSVAIHLDSFRESFLSSLGSGFLTLMFRSFLRDQGKCALVCVREDTGEVIGFVCGSQDRSSYLRRALFRYLLQSVPLLVAALLRRPPIAVGLLHRAALLKSALVAGLIHPQREAALPAASLMSIAVRTSYRGRGAGRNLVRAFTDVMAEKGITAIKLGVTGSNLVARRMYERLGWIRVDLSARAGEEIVYYYVRHLGAPRGPG